MAYIIYPPHEERPYFTTNEIIALDCRRWDWEVYGFASLDTVVAQDEEESSGADSLRLPLPMRWDRELRRRQREGEPDHQTHFASSDGYRSQSPGRSVYTSHWFGHDQHNRNVERERARQAHAPSIETTDSIATVLEEEGVRLNGRIKRALARLQHAISRGEEPASLHHQVSRDDEDEDHSEPLPPYSHGEAAPPYSF